MNIFHKNILRFSIFVVFALAFIPKLSSAASLSVIPSNASVSVGETISVKVAVNGGNTSLNAISGDLLFPTGFFSIESVQKTGSILNFWVTEPSFSNQSGIGHFEGVSLTGYYGGGGTVITYILRAKKEGSATVSFKSGQVLANNGQGTDITNGLSGATYTITPAKVIEKTKVIDKIIEKEKSQESPSLTAPEIYASDKHGERIIIGTSKYPESQALITFTAVDGSKIYINAKSDELGGFNANIPHSLKRGVYSVTAIMVKDDGSSSLVSEKITITVGNMFSDIGFGFYITLLLLILIIIYLLYRLISRYRRGLPLVVIRREIKDVENALKKSFDMLKNDTENVEQKIKLNSNGVKIDEIGINELKQDLKNAEGDIEREIKDIDSI